MTLDLRDIHVPAEPGFWPPAIGWWLLFAIVLLVSWWVQRWLRRRLAARRRVRQVLAELARIEHERPVEVDPLARLVAYSELLRRACLIHAPHAATLTGEDWLRFLDADLPAAPFSIGPGRVLLDGPFVPRLKPEQVQPLSTLLQQRLRHLAERADA